jgi:hypothetical protein
MSFKWGVKRNVELVQIVSAAGVESDRHRKQFLRSLARTTLTSAGPLSQSQTQVLASQNASGWHANRES